MGSNHARSATPSRSRDEDVRLSARPLLDYIDRVRRCREPFIRTGGHNNGLIGIEEMVGETAARWLRDARREGTIKLYRVDAVLTRLNTDRGLWDLYPELYA